MVDVKVVPDLLQVIALRARLEDLDGVPVINVNDVPLQGFNSIVKRVIDIAISGAALVVLAIPLGDHRARSSSSPRAARCSTARSAWASTASRSRSSSSARCTTTRSGRPAGLGEAGRPARARRSAGSCAARTSTSCRSSGTCCAATCRSSARGPERPHFVEQFKHKIPQYMLRHKVKAGLTGWAQVNGWRGNTPLEKRIEYDLYYIENWSVRLDLKIMWLTLHQGLLPQACVLTGVRLGADSSRSRLAAVESSDTRRSHACQHRSSPIIPSPESPVPMKQRIVITGAAGFIGSHLVRNAARSRLRGHRHRQPADRRHRQHRAPGQPRLHVHQARRHELHLRRRAGGFRAALGEPGEPDRLPRAADSDAEGRRARHAQGARPGEGQGRAVRARVDLRGLRRSARASAEGDRTGATSTRSARAACTTRRSGSPRR